MWRYFKCKKAVCQSPWNTLFPELLGKNACKSMFCLLTVSGSSLCCFEAVPIPLAHSFDTADYLFNFEILHSLGLWDTKLSGCSFSVCLASSSSAPQRANLWEYQGQDPSPPPQPYSSHGDLFTSQMTLPTYYPDCFFNFLIFILFSIYLSFYFIFQRDFLYFSFQPFFAFFSSWPSF